MPYSCRPALMPATCSCGHAASIRFIEIAAVKLPSFSFCSSSGVKVIESGEAASGPSGKPTTAWPRGDSGIGSIIALASGGMLSGHL